MNSTKFSLKQQMIKAAMSASASGLSPGRSGNMSVRHENGFFITPSGLAFEELCEEAIVFVDDNGKTGQNDLLPSSEWRFHLDIYKHFPETGGIVHCHSRHATALACANREIPPFHYMVAVAGGTKIPLAPYALFGTQELSDHVVAALDGTRAALLAHHGQIAIGRDLPAALELAYEVEELAAQYVLACSLGPVELLSGEQMQEVVKRFATYGRQDRAS